MNGEAVPISLIGAEPRESACGFSLVKEPEEVHAEVVRTRKALIRGLEAYFHELAVPPIAELITKLR